MPAPYGFVFVVITFFSTMIGGIFTLRKTGVSINILFAFAAGALIGISFFRNRFQYRLPLEFK
jgi:hypothetical protein